MRLAELSAARGLGRAGSRVHVEADARVGGLCRSRLTRRVQGSQATTHCWRRAALTHAAGRVVSSTRCLALAARQPPRQLGNLLGYAGDQARASSGQQRKNMRKPWLAPPAGAKQDRDRCMSLGWWMARRAGPTRSRGSSRARGRSRTTVSSAGCTSTVATGRAAVSYAPSFRSSGKVTCWRRDCTAQPGSRFVYIYASE